MFELNEAQQRCVMCDDKKILSLAGAGAGKTATMIRRIQRLIDDGVDPSSMLVLTFTNAAALEMKERFIKLSDKVNRLPEFRTFHAFCYSLLSTDSAIRNALGYAKTPSIATESDQKRITKLAEEASGIRISSDKRSGKVSMSLKEAQDLEILKRFELRFMRDSMLITFDSLCYDIGEMFVRDDPVITKYKDRFKYIMVDEFQDTDKKQWDFVKSFRDAHLYVCGDALQAIYSFRGSDSSIIKALAEDPEWTTIKMTENYRSTKAIVDHANSFACRYADPCYRVELHSEVDGPAVIVKKQFTDRMNPIDEDVLGEIISFPVQMWDKTTAILVRTNAEVAAICEWFNERNIAYSTSNKKGQAIQILRCVHDKQYMLEWLSTLLNADKYAEWMRLSMIKEVEEPGTDMLNYFLSTYRFTKNISNALTLINKVLEILKAPGLPIVDRIVDVCNELKVMPFLVDYDPDVRGRKLSNVCDYITEELEKGRQSQIYIGTIHSVKGLEYDNVFLLGVDGYSFHLNNEENCNLYYVGATRAKTNLVIYMEEGM